LCVQISIVDAATEHGDVDMEDVPPLPPKSASDTPGGSGSSGAASASSKGAWEEIVLNRIRSGSGGLVGLQCGLLILNNL
jgi:hypothetical protein